MLDFVCRHCDRDIEANANEAGSTIACPHCGRNVVVPAESDGEAAPAPATPAALPPPAGVLAAQTFGQRIWKFIAGSILVIGAAVMTSFVVEALVDYSESANWPTTVGVVENSSVVKSVHHIKGIPITSYKPAIHYSYLVGNLRYPCDKICFGEKCTLNDGTTEATARHTVQRYPTGSQVHVCHDPGNPWNAVLERRVDTAAYLNLVTMLAVGLLGMRLLLVSVVTFSFETNSPWPIFKRKVIWFDGLLLAMFIGGGVWQILVMPFAA